MTISNMHPERVLVLGRFVAMLTIQFWQDHVFGLNVSCNIQSAEAGISTESADISSTFNVTVVVMLEKIF